MKKSNETSVGDAIRQFLKDNRLEDKLNETRLISAWETVTGALVARHTEKLQIRNRKLYVKVDSASLRQEIDYQRTKLRIELNQVAGAEVIDEIIVA